MSTKHRNHYAERRIAELALPRWRSRAELAAERARESERERQRAELEARRERAARLGAEARSLELEARRAAARALEEPGARALAAELATEAATADRVARAALALVPVPWAELSPAELAFRWMLGHHHEPRFDVVRGDYVLSDYAEWATATRAATKAR